MEIVRSSPNVGAEVLGVDLRSVTDGEFGAIRGAFIDHGRLRGTRNAGGS